MRLELRDIWAAPPGAPHPAVRGATLDVRAGEWVAIGGPNGCGKTTLLQVAAGLLEPHRGTRRLDFPSGRPCADASPPRVATILQDPSAQLFAPTVAEEIGLTALHLGMPADRRAAQVQRWSARLGLEGDLGRAPQALSAGRQQLVLLASALAAEPDLLIADEPGAHLDSGARRRVLEALGAETGRGLGILWATQDPDEWNAASRSLTLGEPDAGGPTWPVIGTGEPENPGQATATLMTVRVDRPRDCEGACVRTDRPFELRLPPTGLVCIVGPNGAGKSVLLAAVCGLLDLPQIRALGSGSLRAPPLLIGQYPERQLFEETVGRELTFAAVSRGLGRKEALRQAASALARMGMAARLTSERHTWELSTGEKRVVLLVGALIAPAAFLALDEPTAGLDLARRAALAHLVTEKSRAGLVLIASQDLGWVRSLPCRTVAIPPGKPQSSHSEKTD